MTPNNLATAPGYRLHRLPRALIAADTNQPSGPLALPVISRDARAAAPDWLNISGPTSDAMVDGLHSKRLLYGVERRITVGWIEWQRMQSNNFRMNWAN